MRIAAITAEYNPFHNGHLHQLRQTCLKGATHIVAVMSGNFVQRGELALLDKSLRTKAALLSGVDLVIELPLPWAMSTAERFATGAVSLMNALGVVEQVSFGSETGDVSQIAAAAKAALDPSVAEELRRELRETGCGFAEARERAVAKLYGEQVARPLSSPNDILGVEYIKALLRSCSSLSPVAIPRHGAGHDSEGSSGAFASASSIRRLVREEKWEDIRPLLPPSSFDLLRQSAAEGQCPVRPEQLEVAMLSYLRRMTREELAALPDISEGLENRIYDAVRQSVSLSQLTAAVKTRRYSLARIRRILLSAYLGLTEEMQHAAPPYLRVLGMTSGGQEILREAKKKAALPLLTRWREGASLPEFGQRCLQLEAVACDLYGLAMPCPQVCGGEQTRQVVVV